MVTLQDVQHFIHTSTRFGYRITPTEVERATNLINGGYHGGGIPCSPAQAVAQAFTRPPSAMDKLDMPPAYG